MNDILTSAAHSFGISPGTLGVILMVLWASTIGLFVWRWTGMMVGALIGVMIAIVVGVSVLPSMFGAVEDLQDSGELSSGENALVSVLPIIFVTVIILGAIAWIGGAMGDDGPSWPKMPKASKAPKPDKFQVFAEPVKPQKIERASEIMKPLPKPGKFRASEELVEKASRGSIGSRLKKSIKGALSGEYQGD